eukprot:PhF_6_TR976/c0_g1_i1/m.1888
MSDLELEAQQHAKKLLSDLSSLHSEMHKIAVDTELEGSKDLLFLSSNEAERSRVAKQRVNAQSQPLVANQYGSHYEDIQKAIDMNDDSRKRELQEKEDALARLKNERQQQLQNMSNQSSSANHTLKGPNSPTEKAFGSETKTNNYNSVLIQPPNGLFFTDLSEVPAHLKSSVQVVVDKAVAKATQELTDQLKVTKQFELDSLVQQLNGLKAVHKRQERITQEAEFRSYKVQDQMHTLREVYKPIQEMHAKMQIIDVDALKENVRFLENEREYLYKALLASQELQAAEMYVKSIRPAQQSDNGIKSPNAKEGAKKDELLRALMKQRNLNNKLHERIERLKAICRKLCVARENIEMMNLEKFDNDANTGTKFLKKMNNQGPRVNRNASQSSGGKDFLSTSNSDFHASDTDMETPSSSRPRSRESSIHLPRSRSNSLVQMSAREERKKERLSIAKSRHSLSIDYDSLVSTTDTANLTNILMQNKGFPNDEAKWAVEEFVTKTLDFHKRLEEVRSEITVDVVEMVEEQSSELKENIDECISLNKAKSRMVKRELLENLHDQVDLMIGAFESVIPKKVMDHSNSNENSDDESSSSDSGRSSRRTRNKKHGGHQPAKPKKTRRVVEKVSGPSPEEIKMKEMQQQVQDLYKYLEDKLVYVEQQCIHVHHSVFLFLAKIRTELDIPEGALQMSSPKSHQAARAKKKKVKKTFAFLDAQVRDLVLGKVEKMLTIMSQDESQIRKHLDFATYARSKNISKMKQSVNEAIKDLREGLSMPRTTMMDYEGDLEAIARKIKPLEDMANREEFMRTQRGVFIMTDEQHLQLADIIKEILPEDFPIVLESFVDSIIGCKQLDALYRQVLRKLPPEFNKWQLLPPIEVLLSLIPNMGEFIGSFLGILGANADSPEIIQVKEIIKAKYPDEFCPKPVCVSCRKVMANSTSGMCPPCVSKIVPPPKTTGNRHTQTDAVPRAVFAAQNAKVNSPKSRNGGSVSSPRSKDRNTKFGDFPTNPSDDGNKSPRSDTKLAVSPRNAGGKKPPGQKRNTKRNSVVMGADGVPRTRRSSSARSATSDIAEPGDTTTNPPASNPSESPAASEGLNVTNLTRKLVTVKGKRPVAIDVQRDNDSSAEDEPNTGVFAVPNDDLKPLQEDDNDPCPDFEVPPLTLEEQFEYVVKRAVHIREDRVVVSSRKTVLERKLGTTQDMQVRGAYLELIQQYDTQLKDTKTELRGVLRKLDLLKEAIESHLTADPAEDKQSTTPETSGLSGPQILSARGAPNHNILSKAKQEGAYVQSTVIRKPNFGVKPVETPPPEVIHPSTPQPSLPLLPTIFAGHTLPPLQVSPSLTSPTRGEPIDKPRKTSLGTRALPIFLTPTAGDTYDVTPRLMTPTSERTSVSRQLLSGGMVSPLTSATPATVIKDLDGDVHRIGAMKVSTSNAPSWMSKIQQRAKGMAVEDKLGKPANLTDGGLSIIAKSNRLRKEEELRKEQEKKGQVALTPRSLMRQSQKKK